MKGEGREERHFRFFFDHGGMYKGEEYLLETASATISFDFPITPKHTLNNTHKYTTSPPFHQPTNISIHHTFITSIHTTPTLHLSIHPYKPLSQYLLVTQTSSLTTHIRIVATSVHTFKMGAVVSCVSLRPSLPHYLSSSSFQENTLQSEKTSRVA